VKTMQEGHQEAAGGAFDYESYAEYVRLAVCGPARIGEVTFHVPGAVIGKGRPRIGKVGNHARMFTPAKTVSFENLVGYHAAKAMDVVDGLLFTGPVQANLLIGVQIPASWSKKKQAQALAGTIYPTTKPDLDNSIKSVFDAMNGVVYKDDSQVVTTVCKKRYREAPGLWVTVFQIGGE